MLDPLIFVQAALKRPWLSANQRWPSWTDLQAEEATGLISLLSSPAPSLTPILGS